MTLFNSSELNQDREGTDNVQSEEEDDKTDNDKSSQTNLTASTLQAMETELNRLTAENITLREKLAECNISQETFQNDDEKVKLFTGLPSYAVLATLFTYLKPAITHSNKSSLSKFQKVILVLMRLKLNLPVLYLADKFHVSQATISKSFQSTLHIMYIKLQPTKDERVMTMPMEFRRYFGLKVAVIIVYRKTFKFKSSGSNVVFL
jgi:predicted mannosyl-3-phosphoglycerate phosphatase (HAD superfamily)